MYNHCAKLSYFYNNVGVWVFVSQSRKNNWTVGVGFCIFPFCFLFCLFQYDVIYIEITISDSLLDGFI